MLLKTIVLLTIATTALGTPAMAGFQETEEVPNYCKLGTCSYCEMEDGKKSCSNCYKSMKKYIAGSTRITECVEKDRVSKCLEYHNDYSSSSKTGCWQCSDGLQAKAGTPAGGKTPYDSCEDPTTVVENCIIYGNNKNPELCGVCKDTHYLDTSSSPYTCVVLGSTDTKQNCLAYYKSAGNIHCQGCKNGFMFKGSEGCVATTDPTLGCAESSSQGICQRCDVVHSYFAVDVDSTSHITCKFGSSTLEISAILIGAMIGLMLQN